MLHPQGGPEELLRFRWDIVRYTRGAGIEIGLGPHKAFAHFIGVRLKSDQANPDFEVGSWDELSSHIDGAKLDFVFVWGDIRFPEVRVAAFPLLKEGGYFVDASSDILIVHRKVDDELAVVDQRVCIDKRKTAAVVRYGAIGDAIQTAAICAGLKREGYHVTLFCHPVGEELLRHDPNVDDFFIQDRDQVPNGELADYWKYQSAKYDKWVNLCESVEGTLLAFPGRANHGWPKDVRHKYMNRNYLEFMHEIAELPFKPDYQFYATADEAAQAKAAMSPGYNVVWVLSGSSVHKMYPHTDNVVGQILSEIPGSHVYFVGSDVDSVLEAGWEKELRVHRLCGQLDIRQSIALAQHAQLVVGPETGVLNAVAFQPNAKIVFLSHSSSENLTRDWNNTEALASEDTPCYPCHRLHETREFCPRMEDGAARCQSELHPAAVWRAVQRAHTGWDTVNRILRP
jgi:ADP-heptose:LPS heptosyltransferase